jgi:predicted dehydrogenase
MRFPNDVLAILSASFSADTPVEATIMGTKGFLRLRDRFYNPSSTIELVKDRNPPIPIGVHRENGFGYQFQARHVSECLRNNLIESPVMTHADSMLLMETLDRIRETCGIKYDVDR